MYENTLDITLYLFHNKIEAECIIKHILEK